MRYFLHRLKGNPERGGLDLKQWKKDSRDLNADVLGAWFGGYEGKKESVDLPLLGVRHQGTRNTCVLESCASQKELDEGVELSSSSIAAKAKQLGLLNTSGMSMQGAQDILKNWGISERKYAPESPSMSFNDFTNPSILSTDVVQNADTHKTKSYWTGYKLETYLQQMDEGRAVVLGMMWYTGYNMAYLQAPYILKPLSGQQVFGHQVVGRGYNKNYFGESVVKIQNSYGSGWGDKGCFYVKFADFEKVFSYGFKVNLDIEKDLASWLSLNAHKAILSKDSPKVYVIEDDKKRYVPDEALMWMLEINPGDLVKDVDGMLDKVKDGADMTLADIPPYKLNDIKYFVSMSRDKEYMKSRFSKYFGDLFTN